MSIETQRWSLWVCHCEYICPGAEDFPGINDSVIAGCRSHPELGYFENQRWRHDTIMKGEALVATESAAHLTFKDYEDSENLAHKESCSKTRRHVEE